MALALWLRGLLVLMLPIAPLAPCSPAALVLSGADQNSPKVSPVRTGDTSRS